MDVNLPEGHAVIFLVAPAAGLLDPRILLVSFHEVAAEHNHPCHPEEQNLVCRLLLEKKIEKFLIPRFLWPPERDERQQTGRKPRVQQICILGKLRARTICSLL